MGIVTHNLKNKKGFTIVELIIVVVVIGILAAIIIVSYGNSRASVAEKQVKSDLTQVASAMENYRNFYNNYPTSIPSTFSASDGVTVTFVLGDGTYYCVDSTSTTIPSIKFHYDSRQTSNPISGGC